MRAAAPRLAAPRLAAPRFGAGLAACLLTLSAALAPAAAQDVGAPIAGMRGPTPIAEQPEPPLMPRTEDGAEQRVRSYPEQPPTIPHEIEGYQLHLKANKCLSCHARRRTGESGAPMVSVTHYMDRDGQFLADVSPRRYFCTQCHVPQKDVRPAVENTFLDVDHLLSAADAAE